ncbi:MAG: tetratricopeptide repeat protein, partial [Saprospiraceae bacterium]|nr:tetratricopeptide repeat protein [Saprospiraceae bacterium]
RLNNLALLFIDMSNYEKAEPLFIESKDIRSRTLGKEHPDYATSLNNLAILYNEMSNYEKAEPLYLEAKDIREKILGKEHPDYAGSLNNLAILYWNMGNYEKAEPLYITSKDIRLRTLGKEHPNYAWSLNNLATLYHAMGNYEKSEPLYIESIDIRLRILGKEHPDYATSLNNLALLYNEMGNYEKAEPVCVESKDIRFRTVGKEHPDFAASLNNLAILYHAMGNYEKAEPLYLESKNIREKILGKEHPDYATSLNNLAALYMEMGNYEKAEPLYLEAKGIREKILGNEHPKYAASLNNLAALYMDMGNYEKAESLYLEAIDIRSKALGKEHPDYAQSLNNLAMLYQITERISESSIMFLELSKLNRMLVERSISFSSENQIIAYLKTFEAPLAEYQSFTQRYPNPELLQESYNNALFFNGLTLENNRLLARAIEQADSLTRNIYEKWQGCHRRLAKRYARPIEERKKIAEVEAEAEGYEKMLMRSLPALQQARKAPTWQDVRDQLKSGDAAVEFLHYNFFDPNKTDSILYAALILRPGWDAPKLIPLFEEKQLDSILHTTGERKADYVSQLYSIAERGIIEVEKTQKSLYDLIWRPLEKELDGVHTAYFSPNGLLHRINLAAIPLSSDSTLADRYRLIQLGSTRSLAVGTKAGQLVGQGNANFTNNEAVLFGGIRFEMDSAAIFSANGSLKNSELASRGLTDEGNFETSDRGEQWNYLKWTEKEVKALTPILSSAGLKPETRIGFDATEEAFKSIGTKGNSPRVLHLATHGFFFPDPKTEERKQEALSSETGFKTSDNPLIRSGLLLAGANHAWKSGKPFKKGMENGILTAYEISQMNLSNTELVVLSACETGLGDIQGNEGVYGLQRAFKIAGARYLIMSLWQVPDFQTQELMTTFYTKWLAEKMSIPEAFRSAQQEMREKYENPYFWAGFVLVE